MGQFHNKDIIHQQKSHFLRGVTSRLDIDIVIISRNVISDQTNRIYDIDSIFDGYIQTLTTLLFAA